MSRVSENEKFLEDLVNSVNRTRIKIITQASDEQIKTIFEIFLNSQSLPYTTKEERIFKKHKNTIKSFLNKQWTIKTLRKYFVKNAAVCASITTLVANKIIDGSVCGILNNGD
jgi:uncharacterized membrane protein YheB (UPF0754 family)